MEKKFEEIIKLNDLLNEANIPHKLGTIQDGLQIRVYFNNGVEFDDCVIHSYSHGANYGLLECYVFEDCEGFQTAERVFNEWAKIYRENEEKNN